MQLKSSRYQLEIDDYTYILCKPHSNHQEKPIIYILKRWKESKKSLQIHQITKEDSRRRGEQNNSKRDRKLLRWQYQVIAYWWFLWIWMNLRPQSKGWECLNGFKILNFQWPTFEVSIFCLVEPAVEVLCYVFHFSHCVLQLLNFCLILFYDIYIFVELLVLFKYYFLGVIELFPCVLF